MKRLLGLLLVMAMVGCGGKENAGNVVDNRVLTSEEITEALELRIGEWKYSDGQSLTGQWRQKGVAIDIKGQFNGQEHFQTVVYDFKTAQFVDTISLLDGRVQARYSRWDPGTRTLRIWMAGAPDSDWGLAIQKTGPNSVSCTSRDIARGHVLGRETSNGVRTPNTP